MGRLEKVTVVYADCNVILPVYVTKWYFASWLIVLAIVCFKILQYGGTWLVAGPKSPEM
jgi:hypothetical protein